MFNVFKQWVAVVAGGMLAWPVATWTLYGLRTSDGRIGSPLSLADPFLAAIAIVIGATLAFAVISLVVGRVTNRYTGMLMYGLCWVIVARRGTPIDSILRHIDDLGGAFGRAYWFFAVEMLFWAVPVAVMMALHVRLSPNQYPLQENRFSASSIKALTCNIVLGVALGWVFLRTEAKGQTVFGFTAACAMATMVTRLFWPSCNASILFVVPAAVGVVAAVTTALLGSSDAVARLAAGSFWALGRLTPLDAIAAGTFGTAMGIGLARSFGAEHHPATGEVAPA